MIKTKKYEEKETNMVNKFWYKCKNCGCVLEEEDKINHKC